MDCVTDKGVALDVPAKTPRQTVLVAVPSMGHITTAVVVKLLELAGDPRVNKTFCLEQGKPCDEVRGRINDVFLLGPWHWMLTIDADNPPLGNPFDLIDHLLPVVCCPTYIWKLGTIGHPMVVNALDLAPTDEKPYRIKATAKPHKGLQEVEAIGLGCTLIRRDVLVKLSADGMNPFAAVQNVKGRLAASCDIAFSKRCRDNGFTLHADFDMPCSHFKEIDLWQVGETLAWHERETQKIADELREMVENLKAMKDALEPA